MNCAASHAKIREDTNATKGWRSIAKTREELLDLLNGEHALENLTMLAATEPVSKAGRDVNNHIHTT